MVPPALLGCLSLVFCGLVTVYPLFVFADHVCPFAIGGELYDRNLMQDCKYPHALVAAKMLKAR